MMIVPTELIFYSIRRKCVTEAYINIIRDMYARCKASVMTSAAKTKEIDIEWDSITAEHLVHSCS